MAVVVFRATYLTERQNSVLSLIAQKFNFILDVSNFLSKQEGIFIGNFRNALYPIYPNWYHSIIQPWFLAEAGEEENPILR